MCFRAPRNPDKNAQGVLQVDDNLRAMGPDRKAVDKDDLLHLKSDEGPAAHPRARQHAQARGKTTALPGATNAAVSQLKQLCQTKYQREAGLKGEDNTDLRPIHVRSRYRHCFLCVSEEAEQVTPVTSLAHIWCPTNSRAVYI